MKTLFLDTNILIDFLADKKPFSGFAAMLFSLSEKQKIKLYVSAVSYNNIYYILKQSLGHAVTMKLLDELCDLVTISDVTKSIIKKSLKTDFKDFEDAIQYNCALSVPSIDAIITRDTKDYKKSILPVMNAEEVLSVIQNAGRI